MEKSNSSKKIKLNKKILLLGILGLGIGFAIVTKNFNFTMNTLVKTQSWNVYFENVQVRDGSIEAPLPVISNDKTNVDYSAALELPGEYYEFTVVAVNDGTIDAMIDLINFPELDSSISDKVSYTVTYMDGVVPQRGDVLVAGHSVTYKVRVEYAENYSDSLDVIPFISSFSIDYVLANNQGHNVHVNHDLNSIGIVKHRSIDNYPIYMNNMQVSEGSVDASIIDIQKSKVNYNVVLEEPGDFYEFTIDAVNAGANDLVIREIYKTSLDAETLENLSFEVTYENGDEIQLYDVLRANDYATFKVLVKYLDGAESNMTFNFDFSFNITYGLEPKRFVQIAEDVALSDSSIDFTQISSVTNGRGLYVMNSTISNSNPIYYYRGAVTNNNAKFAGFCWKIVRTTETGGTKLIYNGTPNGSGQCVNTTGTATQTSAFNTNRNLSASGYMYGTVYEIESGSTSSSHVYGNTFTYQNGTYTLSGDTHAGIDSTHHYTCLSSGTTCESIKYVYYLRSGSTAYYITLTGGKSVEDAFNEMNTNTNNSTIKTAVDNWFSGTFATYFTNQSKDYNDYLEDTVWCNDRSMNTIDTDGNGTYTNNGWKPNGGSKSSNLYYSAYGRMQAGTPSLTCSNKNDSFTVEESATGNGALTYPVGLLTADEIVLAGGQSYNVAHSNTDFYLYTNRGLWSMSPYYCEHMYGAYEFYVDAVGIMNSYLVSNSTGVRPSISLKPGVRILEGGDGSSATPYEFIIE